MNLKKITSIFFILILTLSITACKGGKDLDEDGESDQENVNQEKVSGGEINVPITHVKAINPLLNGSSSFYYFNKLIFEGLFEFDEKLEPKEQLVEKYSINLDGSMDIKLKENILWHDGKNLRASDVKFTIDTIKYGIASANHVDEISDMYKPEGILDISKITDVVIKDDKNMTIYFTGESNNLLEMLTFPIISSNIFDDDYEKALATDHYETIGTGPYKQVKYEKLKYVELKVNDKYWGNKAHISTIKGKILKDDELALTSFESGQIDFAFSLDSDWEKYAQDEKVDIHEFPSRRYEFLAVNSKSNVFEGEKGKEVKKAIAYGINRSALIDRVYLGHAVKTNAPIVPTSYLSSQELNDEYKYDIKKARRILEDAGYSDQNEDGIYEDEDKRDLSIKLSTNSYNQSRVRVLEMISDDLKNIGINVVKDYELIDIEDVSEEDKQVNWDNFERKINSGNFELALMGWETSYMQDITQMFHSSSIGQGNFIRYENLELDKILESIQKSNNRDSKKNNYIKAQKIIVEDQPYISLFFTNGTALSNKKIKGNIDPTYTNIYNNIDEWFIPKKYQE